MFEVPTNRQNAASASITTQGEMKMADIFHDFPIKAPIDAVFRAVSTPEGLDSWWSNRTSGELAHGAEYNLWFDPQYDWLAVVSKYVPPTDFELEMTRSSDDWMGTRVGFQLNENEGITHVRFHHTGWPEANDHYRGSSFCWALYLRLLKRYVENGEVVPYQERDQA